MYLRTTTSKNRDGSSVRYFQLAHNVRNPDTGQISAKILHNFGRADQLDEGQLLRLCKSIARVCGAEVRVPGSERNASLPFPEDLPKNVELLRTVELGTLSVIEALWDKLGLRNTLEKAARKRGSRVPYERAVFAMVANRLCEPHSKLGTWERWLPQVYLPECWELKLDQFYEAMDLLLDHIDEVEEMVFFRTANLFNLDVDLIFYDTTTAEFCIDFEDQDEPNDPALRRWGRDKRGGSSVQVVVALAVTREGFPVRSWVFPGNTADVTTIERVRGDLRDWKLGRCLLVGDAGMNDEENREELARACGKYILAARLDTTEVRDEVLGRRGRYQIVSDSLHIKDIVVGEGEKRRRYVLCYNPAEAERQAKRRREVVDELHELLAKHPSRNARQKWTALLRASKRTGRYLSVDSSGDLYVDADKIAAAEKLDGKWVLMTNDDSLTAEEVATSYRAMEVVERCFRSLKSAQIELRPMFHRMKRRIQAHVKLCVLALLIERIAERECNRSWVRLRDSLRKLQATEFATGEHHFFRRNQIPSDTSEILKALKIPPPPALLRLE